MKYLLAIPVGLALLLGAAKAQNTGVVVINPDGSSAVFPDQEEEFSVETLSADEIKSLAKADVALAAAKAEQQKVSYRVKIQHGQSVESRYVMTCAPAMITSVEIRGKYALITKTPAGSCVSW